MPAVVLGLELTVPLGGYAQLNQDPASAPAATVGKQDLPPIQEAEAGEEDRPIYEQFMVSLLAVFESNRAALCAACHINDLPEAPHLRTSPPRPWQRSV